MRQELDLVVDLDFYLEDLLVEVHPEVAIPVVVVLEVADPKEVHLVVVSDEHHENATLHVVSSEVEVLVTMQFVEPKQVGLVLAEPVEVVPTMVDLAVVVDPTVAEVPVVVVLVVEVLAMADLVEVDLEEVDQVQVVPKAVVQEDLAVEVAHSASPLTHPAEGDDKFDPNCEVPEGQVEEVVEGQPTAQVSAQASSSGDGSASASA